VNDDVCCLNKNDCMMTFTRYNVLIVPGGTEIGLEIYQALRYCKDVNLFAAGLNIPNHSPYVFRNCLHLPSIYESGWIDVLNQIILEHKIDYILPAYDDVVVAFAENFDKIKASIVSSPLETCLITRSKSKTYYFLENKIPVPILYKSIEEVEAYPVFLKPDKGQGSQNTHLVSDREDLINLLKQHSELIITEYLPGEEFTVDCFSDRDQGLLFCSGRRRVRTKSGISMNSHLVEDPIFREYAEKIVESLSLYGAWFFQLKKSDRGEYKLLEIAPRIAGTMTLNRNLGVNFPLLSIYEAARTPLHIHVNKMEIEVDRALISRYRHNLEYTKVYVDLDDTLIINASVNVDLIKFLYQCLNRGVELILITKHLGDVLETLEKYRISKIFDEIIHIKKIDEKSDYIRGESAIFIDDSFSERSRVSQRLGIPTFDCSMLEMLLDERV
jgi:carbamoyl-phosphate synthase large subunit